MSKKQRKKIRQAKFSDYQYNGSDSRYKVLFRNGDWLVIKFIHDGAFYSYCLNCREYLHATSILSNPEFITRYSPEKEFTYCPYCGSKEYEVYDICGGSGENIEELCACLDCDKQFSVIYVVDCIEKES